MSEIEREKIVRNWLPRYTGMRLEDFGRFILLTNFYRYLQSFSKRYNVSIMGDGGPMQAATNQDGLTCINFGIGSPDAATVMDLLSSIDPCAVLFLGKCGGLKERTGIGHFVLPIAAIRGEGTGLDYYPLEVPALPSFNLHDFAGHRLRHKRIEYSTGVIYTTNRRVWEWDTKFKEYLKNIRATAIDMETATIFLVGHYNGIPRGALLLVSDQPMMPEGVKTAEKDREVTEKYSELHLDLGIETMKTVMKSEDNVKHLRY